MIEFEAVTKEYENLIALKDFSARIEAGEFVFLIGASGAGKSTFIRLLLREITATRGRVLVKGRDLKELKQRQIPAYRRTIGMVFQDFKLIDTKTAEENVAFAMKVTRAKNAQIRQRVAQVMTQVGLLGRENAFPNELSGGERQRVSIARALVNRPEILIADEPTGNLDQETARGIMELLAAINEEGTTVIMATHAKDLVDRMGRRVIALEQGALVRDEAKGRYDNESIG